MNRIDRLDGVVGGYWEDGVDRKDFKKIIKDLKRLNNYQFIRDDLVLSY